MTCISGRSWGGAGVLPTTSLQPTHDQPLWPCLPCLPGFSEPEPEARGREREYVNAFPHCRSISSGLSRTKEGRKERRSRGAALVVIRQSSALSRSSLLTASSPPSLLPYARLAKASLKDRVGRKERKGGSSVALGIGLASGCCCWWAYLGRSVGC